MPVCDGIYAWYDCVLPAAHGLKTGEDWKFLCWSGNDVLLLVVAGLQMLLDELDVVVDDTFALQFEDDDDDDEVFGVLTGLAVPVDAESLSLSLEFDTLDFLFFSFSCLAFCLCFALLFLNQT